MQTVGRKRKCFRERQYKRSLVTRKLYQVLGEPTLRNLNMMIRQNIIQNFPVTVEDIVIEKKLFSTDVSTLTGRITRKNTKVFVYDFIETPRQLNHNIQELIM